MRTTPHLAEEQILPSTECTSLHDDCADWDSDPMIQLMLKQERERAELADRQRYELRLRRRSLAH